jgi:hypothetical protein
MRDRTFFGIVIGCFIAGLLLAGSFAMKPVIGDHQSRSVAWKSR